MDTDRYPKWTRRELLRNTSAVGAAGLLGLGARTAAAEPPPETATIRITLDLDRPFLCWAPKYLARELLRLEGFTDVQFVPYGEAANDAELLAAGAADIAANLVTGFIVPIDQGLPIVVLTGMHAGCTELFAADRVRSIRELRGKRVAVPSPGGGTQVLVSAIAGHIGLVPSRDIEWVVESDHSRWPGMLETGEVDAVCAFPPQTWELRAARVGHVIFNTTVDLPWRHYFCCMMGGRREFVREHPVATKRAIRALLKANQLCSLEPERVARLLVERGATDRYEYAIRLLREVPYGAWRTYDPVDTVRFFSLRLRDAGLVKSTPREIIERGTDFRFLGQLRRELKS